MIPPTPTSTPRVDAGPKFPGGRDLVPPTPVSTPRASGASGLSVPPPTPMSTPRLGADSGGGLLPPTPASTPRVPEPDKNSHVAPPMSADTLADVEPLGDRLVVFQSRLLEHEVLPVYAPRYALTVWFY